MELSFSLTDSWQNFSWLTAAVVFISYFVVDAMYAYYTLKVVELKAGRSATTGAIMYLLLAVGIISYTQNILYLIPLVMGAWLGTFAVVRFERTRRGERSAYAEPGSLPRDPHTSA